MCESCTLKYKCKRCARKATLKKYNASDKGKATHKRYRASIKGKKTKGAYDRVYSKTAHGKESSRRRRIKWSKSEKGIAFRREYYWNNPEYFRCKSRKRAYKLSPDYVLADKCAGCNTEDKLELDHKYPLSKGGSSNDTNNLWTLCRSCNAFKSNRLLTAERNGGLLRSAWKNYYSQ